MTYPYATIPLNQPNREQLIAMLEAIRIDHPEDWERNVRECSASLDPIKTDSDVVFWENGRMAFSAYDDRIYCYSTKWYSNRTFHFRIKTRKP